MPGLTAPGPPKISRRGGHVFGPQILNDCINKIIIIIYEREKILTRRGGGGREEKRRRGRAFGMQILQLDYSPGSKGIHLRVGGDTLYVYVGGDLKGLKQNLKRGGPPPRNWLPRDPLPSFVKLKFETKK